LVIFEIARLSFETPQPSLGGRTPLDVIEAGNQDAVIGLVLMIDSDRLASFSVPRGVDAPPLEGAQTAVGRPP